MSYYYSYYLGYKDSKGKIIPLGPYDNEGKLKTVIERSRSFASDLHEDFREVQRKEVSEQFRKEFEYTDWDGKKTLAMVGVLPVKELPSGSYIKKGYFLISDVQAYEKDHDTWDLFYDCLTPEVYAQMVQNELTFGPPKKEVDCEGEDITPHSARDYMYYAYPDYSSREYEASFIRDVAYLYLDYSKVNEDNLYVIKTEG